MTWDYFLFCVRRWDNEDNRDKDNELYIYDRPNEQVRFTNRGRNEFEERCA
jgi:hypothetical protein